MIPWHQIDPDHQSNEDALALGLGRSTCSNWIYMIGECGCDKYVKIGRTTNILARVGYSGTMNPRELRLIDCFAGPAELERIIQKRCQAWLVRPRAEWFYNCEAVVAHFRSVRDAAASRYQPTPSEAKRLRQLKVDLRKKNRK